MRYDVEVQPIPEVDNPAFPDPQAYPLDTNNIAPRVGLTYDLSGDGRGVAARRLRSLLRQDALRADLGDPDGRDVLGLVHRAVPGQQRGPRAVERRPADRPDARRAGQPSIARLLASLYPPGSRVKNNGTVTLDNPDRVIPYTDQITAGYERQLWSTLSVSADYVHARARDQFMLQDLNPGLRASTSRTATLVRINPAYAGAVNQPINAGSIDYDALEVALVKRFASDYSFRVSYTLGDSRGNTTGAGIPLSGFQVLDDLNLDLNEGPTNVDRRHNLVISGQALVPKTSGLTVAWVARALSGSTVHLARFDDRSRSQRDVRRAVACRQLRQRRPESVERRFRRRAQRSDRARASFRLDLRLGYRLRPGTGRSLDLFVDVFNVTNRANFENPTGDRRSTDFLNLTTLRAGAVPTTAQIGVRMQF